MDQYSPKLFKETEYCLFFFFKLIWFPYRIQAEVRSSVCESNFKDVKIRSQVLWWKYFWSFVNDRLLENLLVNLDEVKSDLFCQQ